MHPHLYAEAYYNAATNKSPSEQEALAVKLRTILAERHHLRLLPRIIRELESIVRRRGTTQGAVVHVARMSDIEEYAVRIARDLRKIDSGESPYDVRMDDTLVGGYDVRANGLRIDRTYKRVLLELYGTLIT